MRKVIPLIMVVGLGFPDGAGEPVPPDFKEQARAAVREYASSLQGALGRAMKEGGPTLAIQVCSRRAMEIAGEVGQARGLILSRTTSKPRNPSNAPDPWAEKVLRGFEKRLAGGEDPDALEYAEVVQGEDARVARYMKPILIKEFCLSCHGADLKPGVAEAIRKAYPKDRATGYKAGDLRGAFSVSKILQGP